MHPGERAHVVVALVLLLAAGPLPDEVEAGRHIYRPPPATPTTPPPSPPVVRVWWCDCSECNRTFAPEETLAAAAAQAEPRESPLPEHMEPAGRRRIYKPRPPPTPTPTPRPRVPAPAVFCDEYDCTLCNSDTFAPEFHEAVPTAALPSHGEYSLSLRSLTSVFLSLYSRPLSAASLLHFSDLVINLSNLI